MPSRSTGAGASRTARSRSSEARIERLANPAIRDTLARLAAESSDRIPTWLVPVIRERLADDGDVTLSAAIIASWARDAEGVDEQGAELTIVDRLADERKDAAAKQSDEPLAFVRSTVLFGDLADDARFTEPSLDALRSLHERGATATLAEVTAG